MTKTPAGHDPYRRGEETGSSAATDWRWLLSIFVTAMLARGVWAALLPIALVSDSHAYDLAAWNIAQGYGYCLSPGQPTARWPVGAPLVYGLIYATVGHSYVAVKVYNVLIGAAVAVMTAVLARKWFGHRAGWVAGMLVALWPSQIELTTSLFSEAQFNFLLTSALVVALQSRLSLMVRGVSLGVLLAATSYTRPIGLLLPLIFAWCSLLNSGSVLAALRGVAAETALVIVVMAALIMPWSLRNQRAFGHPVLMQTSAGEKPLDGQQSEHDRTLHEGTRQSEREEPGRVLRESQARGHRLHPPGPDGFCRSVAA